MTIRIKWLLIQYNNDIFKDIKAEIIANEFTHGMKVGFRTETVTATSITSRFISVNEFSEEVEDPFGNISIIPRVVFTSYRFKIDHTTKLLTIINPPRNVKDLLNFIARTSNYKLSISTINVNILEWVNNIQDKFTQLLVTKLVGSGIQVSELSTAQVLIAGTEDVQSHFERLMNGKTGRISKSRLSCSQNDQLVTIEISDQASATIVASSNRLDEISDILSTTLLLATAPL